MGFKIDNIVYGHEPLGLILCYGDVKTARLGLDKVLDGQKRMLARVKQGEASADGYVCAP